MDVGKRSAPGHYLDSATYGLPSADTLAALHGAMEAWRTGAGDWIEDWERAGDEARSLYARVIGVVPARVALIPAASVGVGVVAAALPSGSRVLVANEDFTSVLFPFLEQQRVRDLDVTFAPLAQLPSAVREGIDLVAVSHVQSASGAVLDVDELLAVCRSAGARLLLDITQAAGAITPVRAWSEADYVVTAAYKWLCAPRGVAFLSVPADDGPELAAVNAGWRAGEDPFSTFYGPPLRLAETARRLDVSLAWLLWVGAAQALREFVGAADELTRQYGRSRALVRSLCTALDVDDPGAGIVSVAVEGDDVGRQLADRGIKASSRQGRVRLSFHHYNDEQDVATAVDVLQARVRR